MQSNELKKVFKKNQTQFWLWLSAMLGGILLSLLASLTVLFIHYSSGDLLPDWKSIMLAGVVAVSVSGLSYIRAKEVFPDTTVSSKLLYVWPILLMISYGLLIAIGVKEPSISGLWVFIISVVMCYLSIHWSAILWLHEQGIRDERQDEVVKPNRTPGLDDAVSELPLLPNRGEQ